MPSRGHIDDDSPGSASDQFASKELDDAKYGQNFIQSRRHNFQQFRKQLSLEREIHMHSRIIAPCRGLNLLSNLCDPALEERNGVHFGGDEVPVAQDRPRPIVYRGLENIIKGRRWIDGANLNRPW